MTKKEKPLILAEDGCLTINKQHTHGSSGGEGGSDGNAFIIDVEYEYDELSGDVYTLNKTWQEIYDAMMSGKNCVLFCSATIDEGSENEFVQTFVDSSIVVTLNSLEGYMLLSNAFGELTAETPDSYPSTYYGR